MLAHVITIMDNQRSFLGATNLIRSSKTIGNIFNIQHFNAVTPLTVSKLMTKERIKWDYPWEGSQLDIKSGLIKSSYQTNDPLKRMSCAMSHYYLWKDCVHSGLPFLILEHDSIFIKRLDYDDIIKSNYNIVGLNDPRRATRKSGEYFKWIQERPEHIQPVPTVDDYNIPQGLAGNSAYIIKPEGAQDMLDAVNEYGMWPNDALMCKQLIKKMGVTKEFYTRVQGLPSSTTL